LLSLFRLVLGTGRSFKFPPDRKYSRCGQATRTKKRMTKIFLKYSIWTTLTILTLGLIGYFILLNTFDIFATPDKKIISYKCDHEGLRQAEVIRVDGNAVTNTSLNVSVYLDCKYGHREDGKNVFTVDEDSFNDNDVKINWTTFDTLTIEYKKGLKIINKEKKITYSDSTLNFTVTYKVTD
jgi:hypothetical protein